MIWKHHLFQYLIFAFTGIILTFSHASGGDFCTPDEDEVYEWKSKVNVISVPYVISENRDGNLEYTPSKAISKVVEGRNCLDRTDLTKSEYKHRICKRDTSGKILSVYYYGKRVSLQNISNKSLILSEYEFYAEPTGKKWNLNDSSTFCQEPQSKESSQNTMDNVSTMWGWIKDQVWGQGAESTLGLIEEGLDGVKITKGAIDIPVEDISKLAKVTSTIYDFNIKGVADFYAKAILSGGRAAIKLGERKSNRKWLIQALGEEETNVWLGAPPTAEIQKFLDNIETYLAYSEWF